MKSLILIPDKQRMTLLMVILLAISCVSAQSIFDDATQQTTPQETNKTSGINLHGYTRAVMYVNPDFKSWGHTFAEAELRLHAKQGPALMKADVRLRKNLDDINGAWILEPCEVYAGLVTQHFDLLAGYQIVSWGRTDGFNPTDNITPKNYFFLSDNPDDQWMPNMMLRAKIRPFNGTELEIIGIPAYQASVYQYNLFDMGANVVFNDPLLPERIPKNATLAARLNFEWPVLGGSVSWFRGYDPYRGFSVQQIDWSGGAPMIFNAAESYLKTSWGADLAIPVGSTIFRGEVARNITENPDDRMHIPLSDWSYVAAIEKNASGITLIAQYIGKYMPDFSQLTVPVLIDPMNPLAQMQYANEMILFENRLFNRKIFHQQEQTNHAVLLTLSGSFAYDTWNAECTGYYNLTSGEWLIRPVVKFSMSDALQLTVGANYMMGGDKTLFSYASEIMNGIFGSLKVNF
jgi:hypothetical protein